MNPHIIGIRFQKVGKIYHFDATKEPDLGVGDFVVVETSRGHQLGEVVQVLDEPNSKPNGKWKPIHHKATPRDLVLRQIWQRKEMEAVINCRSKTEELGIEGIKIVAAEFTFDGSRLSIMYSTDADTKVDIRDLQKALRRTYTRSRVELRQIGPRDVAKIIGGMGACGLETRCCTMFLTEFSPISIKMAKEQGISLTPSEITGICGRLRCCLIYEYEQYLKARREMPKRNKRVETPHGEGTIVDIYPLRETVVVLLESGNKQEFHNNDIQPWEELQALRQKSQQPCPKHPEGGCNCASLPARSKQTSKKKGKRFYRRKKKTN